QQSARVQTRTSPSPLLVGGTGFRNMPRCPHVVVLLALVAYLLATVPRLAVYPPIGEDEPWIAAAPYKLATEGALGSDLFTGYYGMERHHFEQMPLFPLLQ